jgi:hypothetical protein
LRSVWPALATDVANGVHMFTLIAGWAY